MLNLAFIKRKPFLPTSALKIELGNYVSNSSYLFKGPYDETNEALPATHDLSF